MNATTRDCASEIAIGASGAPWAYLSDDLSYVYMPGNDTAVPAMEACCDGNPVGVVDECTLFCELPEYVEDGTDFMFCLDNNNYTATGVGIHESAGVALNPTIGSFSSSTVALVAVLSFMIMGS